MFTVIIPRATIKIEGCPPSGIPAIDFRRQYNFPDSPTNTIVLPDYEFVDEEFVRAKAQYADDNANIDMTRFGYYPRRWVRGEIKLSETYCRLLNGTIVIPPKLVREYLSQQIPETAKALIQAVWLNPIKQMAQEACKAFDLGTESGRQEALIFYEGDTDGLSFALMLYDAMKDGVVLE
jgi:hypothetical protein